MMAEPWRWRHMMAEVWYGIPKDTNRRIGGGMVQQWRLRGVVADDAVA